jgi:hypothetical protein
VVLPTEQNEVLKTMPFLVHLRRIVAWPSRTRRLDVAYLAHDRPLADQLSGAFGKRATIPREGEKTLNCL